MNNAPFVEAFLDISAIDHHLEVLAYEGHEAISELFDFTLTIACVEPLDLDAVVACEASLRFDRQGQTERCIQGVIAEFEDLLSANTDHYLYKLRLVPSLWRATLVQLIDVYMDMDLPALLAHKFDLLALLPEVDFQLRLLDSYPLREFVVQYEESDLAFLSRQLEHAGIHFCFEHHQGNDVMVIGDGNHAFSPIGADGQVPFHGSGEQPGVFELSHKASMIPSHYIQRDYNYRQHGAGVTADVAVEGPGCAGAVYEYGAHLKTQDEAQRTAQIRSEERACRQKLLTGRSTLPALRAGGRTTLIHHPRGELDLLITRVTHHGTQGFYAQDGAAYHNEFEAVRPDVPYRPLRRTPKPRVSGFLSGLIESESDSEYADVDDLGRYRVRFLFDTAPAGERQASRPVRMMQPHAGPGYGMHFPLRGGVEVLIAFVGGDPDRPIIAGTVPNPRTPSPVASGNRERNVIRTGGGNEINIDDSDGEQRIKLSTPKRGATLQLGAPNLQEDGAALQSTTGVTNVGTGSVNQLGAFANTWSMWNAVWGNHITNVAGKVMAMDYAKFGIDAVNGSIKTITGNLRLVQSIREQIVHFKTDEVKEKQEDVDDAKEALDKATAELAAAEAAEQTREDNFAGALAGVDLSNLTQAERDAIAAKAATYQTAVAEADALQLELEALRTERTAHLANGDSETVKALDALIAAKQIELDAQNTAVGTALAALDTELTQWERELEQAEELLLKLQNEQQALDPGAPNYASEHARLQGEIDAQQLVVNNKTTASDRLDLTSYHAAKDPLDAARRHRAGKETAYRVLRGAWLREVGKLKEKQKDRDDEEKGWKVYNDVIGYIDKVVAPGLGTLSGMIYSWVATVRAMGIQGYAANSTEVMMTETLEQRRGAHRKVYVIKKSKGFGEGGRDADKEDGDRRRNTGWGALSRIRWVPRGSKNPKALEATAKYFLRGGGGAGLQGGMKDPLWAIVPALLTPALGPVAGGLFMYLYMKKGATEAFKEARNIQGSEQKAVLFGKESVFINGQERTTVASGKKLLLTSNQHAVFHTRGEAEVVGIESAYLASAKKVDILSRGAIDMHVTDRSLGGKYDHDSHGKEAEMVRLLMTTDPPQPAISKPFKATAAGDMTGNLVLETQDNSNPQLLLGRLRLSKQEVSLVANSTAKFADASLTLECQRQNKVASTLILNETSNTKVAKLLAGSFGVEIEGEKSPYAALVSDKMEVRVTDTTLSFKGKAAKDAYLELGSGVAGAVRADKDLTLKAASAVTFETAAIDCGGAELKQANIMVQAGPGAGAVKTTLEKAIADIHQAMAAAKQEADRAAQARQQVATGRADSVRAQVARLDHEHAARMKEQEVGP